MTEFTIMSYNFEHMKQMFNKGKLKNEMRKKAEAASTLIKSVNPDILGICEASNKLKDHETFLSENGLDSLGYNILKSEINRGKQDLVLYYKEPFEPISVDTVPEFYDPWLEDIDDDNIKEYCEFERIPLEVVFRVKGTDIEFMIILVLAKSKGVFSVVDFYEHQKLALANRKRLYAQSKKIRNRLDELLDSEKKIPVILMGDMNDEPGLDPLEKHIGASSVETLMGSVFEPDKIFHNTLWHMENTPKKKDLWTAEFPDPIVANYRPRRVWLDHIFVSPDMLRSENKFRYVMNSGAIAEKTESAKIASDHFPIYCKVEI